MSVKPTIYKSLSFWHSIVTNRKTHAKAMLLGKIENTVPTLTSGVGSVVNLSNTETILCAQL